MLDCPGISDAQHDCRDQEERCTNHGQTPLAGKRRNEKQDRDNNRDARKNLLSRDHRIGARVHRARRESAGIHERAVLVHPQADRLYEEIERDQHRCLDTRCLGNAKFAIRERNTTVQVARRDPGNQRDQQHRRGKTQHPLPQRQIEQVERDVQTKLGVSGTRFFTVPPEQHLLPPRSCGGTREQANHCRKQPFHEATKRLKSFLIAIQLRRKSGVHGTLAIGNVDREKHWDRHRDKADRKHHAGRDPLRGKDREEVHLRIPQHLRDQ